MLSRITSFFHRLRRRLSRSEWAIRNLDLPPSHASAEEPGLLLIQIDGLAQTQLKHALASKRMPFLQSLLEKDGYSLHTHYSGLPSTTPAVQAELFYGIRAAVPAFQFCDRERNQVGAMDDPAWAKKFEARFQSQAEGLLEGGSSWSNIYQGGASVEESHFCGATIGLHDMWRTGKFGRAALFLLAQFPSFLRILGLIAIELGIAIPLAVWGILRGEAAKRELVLLLSRAVIGIGLREFITIGAKVDLARGLPIVYVNFLGYDELSHRRGPGSPFAHWALTGIDRAIRLLHRSACTSQRRDYQVWILSDHGQERTRSFEVEIPGGLGGVVERCLKAEFGPAAPSFKCAAMGPLGHFYFEPALDDLQKHALSRRLIAEGGVPGVLYRSAAGAITWHHQEGQTAVPEEAEQRFGPHPAAIRAEMARDLVTFAEHPLSGDLIILGWSDTGPAWTFAPERGAHGGPGPEETRGFLLVPPVTRLPEGAEDFVRPRGIRAAARALLGRELLNDAGIAAHPAGDAPHLRALCYNAHSCVGLDGRTSPRRIARVIARHAPDFAAIQELDLGHPRTRGEDQARIIGDLLGYHVSFCPTVVRGEHRYGHALLSRRPMEIVKVANLPVDPQGWLPEPRAAIWARVSVHDSPVNVVSTHFGLSKRERLAQIQALLGGEWLGSVLDHEPVVLCGDFNFLPNSAPYRLALGKLRDVQAPVDGRKPFNTFTSLRPFLRLDHVFVSRHFAVDRVEVTRDRLTRVASDHLPIFADLRLIDAPSPHSKGEADKAERKAPEKEMVCP